MNDSQSEAAPDSPASPTPEVEKPEEHIQVPDILPALATGGMVLFPGLMVPLASPEESFVGAIDEAAGSANKMLAIFAQKPAEDGQPTGEPYSVGTAAVIARMAKAPNGAVQAIIQGVARVTLLESQQQEPWLRVRVEDTRRVKPSAELEALAAPPARSSSRPSV
jgi:ATP-dependent Lon protease